MYSDYKQLQKPLAPTTQAQSRWSHQALRRRLLLGLWEDDLIREMERHLPADRQESWGPPDLSANPFRAVVHQLAVLYSEDPVLSHPEGSAEPLIGSSGMIAEAGLWQIMQWSQKLCIGQRETLIRVDVTEQGSLLYRAVPADMVYAEASPDLPDVPLLIIEYRVRQPPEGGAPCYYADVVDIRDSQNPLYQIREISAGGKLGEDKTEDFLGSSLSGESYPYRDKQGSPIMPYVLYHAEKTGALWDAWTGAEIIWGTLTVGVLYSFGVHILRDCSYPQRYVLDAIPAGLDLYAKNTNSRRATISTDPASILVFSKTGEGGGQPIIGQWQAGGDPHTILEAVSAYEYRVASYGGITPAEVQRVRGADPRSGYALSISRAGQREAQKKFSSGQMRGDLSVVRLSAILLNRFTGTNYPEEGYRISYQSLPLSADEKTALREDVLAQLAQGLLSKIDAYMILNGVDREEAISALQRIAEETIREGLIGNRL